MDNDLLRKEIAEDISKEYNIPEDDISVDIEYIDPYTDKYFLTVEIENEGNNNEIAMGCKVIIHNNLYNSLDIDVSETLIDVDNCGGTLVLTVCYRER